MLLKFNEPTRLIYIKLLGFGCVYLVLQGCNTDQDLRLEKRMPAGL